MSDKRAKPGLTKSVRLCIQCLWVVAMGILVVFCHCAHAKTIGAMELCMPAIVTICAVLLFGSQYKRFLLNAFWMVAFALMFFCLDAESGVTSIVLVILGGAAGYPLGARFPICAGVAVSFSAFVTAAISGVAFTEDHWTKLGWSFPVLLPICLTGAFWSCTGNDHPSFVQ